jgi:hypothetical protein
VEGQHGGGAPSLDCVIIINIFNIFSLLKLPSSYTNLSQKWYTTL